jgi:serine/threonine protein kinase
VLEFCEKGTLRQLLEAIRKTLSTLLLSQRLRWAEQAAREVSNCHSNRVVHDNLCCKTILLRDNLVIKLGDLGGSSFDGSALMVCYSTSHDHPRASTILKGDIFALENTLYKIVSGMRPHAELTDRAITDHYERSQYPSIDHLSALGGIISNCWRMQYSSAEEFLIEMTRECRYDF